MHWELSGGIPIPCRCHGEWQCSHWRTWQRLVSIGVRFARIKGICVACLFLPNQSHVAAVIAADSIAELVHGAFGAKSN